VSKGTLLLADDSITIQKVVNLTFADEGIDVIAVGDGDLAAARLAEITPDIVLADVNMPGLTGYQICEMIRMNESTRDLPVVLLVGSFEPFDEAEANRVGASSYMTKPFQSIRQLVSQVTDLMEARNQPAEVEIPMESPAPVESAEAMESFESIEAAAPPAVPRETNDIDSLYQNSFGVEADGQSAEESSRSSYIDAGMDDEMIQTSFSDEDAAPAVQDFREEPEPFQFDETQPSAVPSESSGEPEPLTLDTEPAEIEHRTDQDSVPAFSGESTAAAVAFDQFSDTVSMESEPLPSANEPTEPVRRESDNVFEMPLAASAATTARQEFDEVDLLEIPGFDSGRTLEFTTEQAAAALGSKAQIVSLSPELMEIIVQKVVEKLSEKY
jgi:CheY-like chemotaxis protein